MTPQNESDAPRHSEFGIASAFAGGAMMLVQLGVLAAVLRGVKDNQGVIYAVSIPFFMYCVGVPLGLLAACIGFIQPRRDRRYAVLGVVLTLAGPLLFAIFVAVQLVFRPW